ncbi:hypothetical protein ACGFIP_32360 [Micromonospora zamorensis]|uniref:hypothetical protein n=1 Tax=Micromonospora zamorensis TaxID=709883 RepID=UPI00371CDC02
MTSSLVRVTNVTPTRSGGLLGALYTRLTGKPYITVGGCASRDFGPTPGAEIADVFDVAAISDDVLMANAPQLLAAARRITADMAEMSKTVQP